MLVCGTMQQRIRLGDCMKPKSLTTGFGMPVQKWLWQMGQTDGSGGPSHAWARTVARGYAGEFA